MLDTQPMQLPFCAYPPAHEVGETHTLFPLPAELPRIDLDGVQPYRSRQYTAVPADQLSLPQVWELAQVVGTSFSKREPMCRHIIPPLAPPLPLDGLFHEDMFGRHAFGPWTRESLLHWFIRLLVLTDPTSPLGEIQLNDEVRAQSMAILGRDGRVLGGAINEPMPPLDVEPSFRVDDPFLAALFPYLEPVLVLLGTQDSMGVTALCEQYPAFAQAYAHGRVGHHFMIARSDELSKLDTFELLAGTVLRYQQLGYEYVLVEATNQWTGAACEALGAVRVQYAAFRATTLLPVGAVAVAETAVSPDGFIAHKNSGSMFYVLRL
jgi:hypothetical protein